MSYSIVKLTLYALLTSLENDLRDVIRKQICHNSPIDAVVGADLLQILKGRFDQDDNGGRSDLFEYLDFADAFKLVGANKAQLGADLKRAISENVPVFDRIAPIRNRVMHSRPLKFDDATQVTEAVRRLLRRARSAFPHLSEMEQKLGESPEYALSLEIRPFDDHQSGTTHNLPIPDFDETGFLGRRDDVGALIKALKGPYPVITVLGEGGIGKTALALQAAYDILDDEKRPFQAIIWTSSKTTRLTAGDIQRIEGAIESSMGLLRDVQRTLAGQSNDNAYDEVLEYLDTFKILLILDNFETVLDQNIKEFLKGLTGQSKILMTSRVGIGALDYPYPLPAMGRDDARQLLRATAQVRRVRLLS